jgi:hypothetical protein
MFFQPNIMRNVPPVPSLTCHKMRFKETASRDKSSTGNDATIAVKRLPETATIF